MAAASVLPFVRGVDFSGNNFQDDLFPKTLVDMSGLRWLKLNKTSIAMLPDELSSLSKLEHLHMSRNNLIQIHGDLPVLSSLRTLNVSHNKIRTSGIPNDIFALDDISIVDFSHNEFVNVPEEMEKARSMLSLNLSHNKITEIPNQLFVQLTDLIYLNLSDNNLPTLPPQMRRLVNLQTLILNNNPLDLAQLRQVVSMTQLKTLHLRNTQRSLENMPVSLEMCPLEDVDLSCNDLPKIPDAIFQLKTLLRLNLSSNNIESVEACVENLSNLEVLNLARNKLKSLPPTIVKLVKLRKLIISSNEINFDGLPTSIGRLICLEQFVASGNKLESVPEGLFRCPRIKKIALNSNQLITIPEAVHFITELETLDVRDNPDLVMPPKPIPQEKVNDYYNVDFSLSHQLRLVGATPPPQEGPPSAKEAAARKQRIRRRRQEMLVAAADAETAKQAKVLQGMSDLARGKVESNPAEEEDDEATLKGPKSWMDQLTRPQLDYSDYFTEETGQLPGLTIWQIENFVPIEIEESLHGKFYDADCYIVLETSIDDQDNLHWQIYYWIGKMASLDKKACSAIHAVHLRNCLNANTRTIREEQGDESEEFLALYEDRVMYIEGGTTSGFYSSDEKLYTLRMYRLCGSKKPHLESVPLVPDSLDPRYVFIVDNGMQILIWYGLRANPLNRSKARLMAEKISKMERKNEAQINMMYQGNETEEFWNLLGGYREDFQPEEWLDDFVPEQPKLYTVGLGTGYLELPQVDVVKGKLKQSQLNTKNVYILDCNADLFVWIGRQSSRLVRAAALKLAQEVCNMLTRPSNALVIRVLEGTEGAVYKSKFSGWDDVLAVDFTKRSEDIRRGPRIQQDTDKDTLKTDLSALFMPRQPPMKEEETNLLMEEWNEDLDGMEAFVLEGKKFARLPAQELGHFHSGDCYVFLCRYWVPKEVDEDEEGEKTRRGAKEKRRRRRRRKKKNSNTLFISGKGEMPAKWDGSHSPSQQENLKFLSHFKKKFIIYRGNRKYGQQLEEATADMNPRLFHIRANGSNLCTRCIEVTPNSLWLNSEFCYIFMVPFNSEDCKGIVYSWIGSKSDEELSHLTEEMAYDMFPGSYSHQVISEGEEPENFWWVALPGNRKYETSADYMRSSRLFRCSNEKGYYTVSEKCSDFCQDDLADDDVMILDTGFEVYMWVGPDSSDVERKLAFKSVQVYVQHLKNKENEQPRKLTAVKKGKEIWKFIKCFHGWGKFRTAPR
ncbi:hypothetical protein BSL78_17779 [Apostichopus japonicus]|uniref:Gelsolin-like domain-containing protein n=1 Tax=Stichopus japonicus TaxID=307972 RepID=A0A2G8KBG9_STIJA|nr:hypothetical protein BSL78_17779 [Apostichopus japonicus]